jgi:hypothetical protein
MNTTEAADELARNAAAVQDAVLETAASLPVIRVVAESLYSGNPLLEAAEATRRALELLTRLDNRLAELTEKSHELDKLKAAHTEAREHRTKLLADAVLAGDKKANTTEVDKRCAAALVALQKREDEVIAVESALKTLQAQRESARSALTGCAGVYAQARDVHLAEIKRARSQTLKFCEAIAEGRASLDQMPAHFRERLLSAKVNLECPEMPSIDALQELTTSQAEADLIEAAKLAAIPPPPAPKFLGYVWGDGFERQDPEPIPELLQQFNVGLVQSE